MLLALSCLLPIAGADIKEMACLTFAEAYGEDKFNEWARLGKIRKPVSRRTLTYVYVPP